MKAQNFHFAVTRAYRSDNVFDSTSIQNLIGAKSVGFYADVYIFPCVPCGNPQGQINNMLDRLGNTPFGMVWLDIEVFQWSSNHQSNINFIEGMINAVVARIGEKRLGIYTNYYMWQSITGLATFASYLPLWYAHYDDSPNYNDFRAFGGWTKPSIKQYKGTTDVCGTGVDLNFYP